MHTENVACIRVKFWRLVVFVCVITGNRSSQFLLEHGFQSNFVLKIYIIELVVDRSEIKTAIHFLWHGNEMK